MNAARPLIEFDEQANLSISFDAHVAQLTKAGENLFVVRVASETTHPRVSPGDLLLIEEDQDGRTKVWEDKTLLLVRYHDQYILRQKKFVKAMLKRAGLHAVGNEHNHTPSVEVVGRVIGWIDGRL